MNTKSMLAIIGKDLRIFFRSKFSAFTIILFPLLIVLLAGVVFNSSALSGVVIGTYSESYTDLSNKILSDFEDQGFGVNRLNSIEDCTSSVKQGTSQICLILPKDLNAEGSAENVLVYADHSRINIAYTLVNELESSISAEASELGVALAQDLIDVVESVKTSLPNQKTDLSDSISKLNSIENALENKNLSSDIDSMIADLEAAKENINGSTQSIDDVIDSLKELKVSVKKASSGLEDAEETSDETITILNKVSANINTLITSSNSVSVTESSKVVSPIKITIESVGEADSNNRNYFFPTLFALIALFGGILLSSTFILKEKHTKAYFRNFMTPAKDLTFIFGSYLTCLIILGIQFSLVFSGVVWILKMPISAILAEVLLILFISLTMFIFLGMFIGYLFKSHETTIFSSVLVAAVLMFFSNTILPIESISSAFKRFAEFNPLVVSEVAFRKVMLFELSYSSIAIELYIMLAFTAIFIFLNYIFRKIAKRRL